MQSQKLINLCSFLLGVFILSACEYTTIRPELPSPVKVSFKNDIIPIFNSGCNAPGCHNSTGPKPDLTPANAYQSLMDNNIVIPGNGSQSTLWVVLQPNGIMGAYGNAKNNATIKSWIDQGAENN